MVLLYLRSREVRRGFGWSVFRALYKYFGLKVSMNEKSFFICHAEPCEASGIRTCVRDSSLRDAPFRMTRSRNIMLRIKFYAFEPLF